MVNYCVAAECTNIPNTNNTLLRCPKDPKVISQSEVKSRCEQQELSGKLLQLPTLVVNILLQIALSQILC